MVSLKMMRNNRTSTGCCDAGPLGPSLGEICISSNFFVFMTLLNKWILSNKKISGSCERVKPIEETDEEYDYVVIGGGAGGAVVAGRLSEDPKSKTLLLEAGPDESAAAEVPLLFFEFVGTRVDWNFTTTNESYACPESKSCPVSVAKMLGGGTAHNGMVYVRGNPTDYDKWAEQGNEGWSWKEVRPFYLLGENNTEIKRVGQYYHATDGPLTVGRFPYMPPLGNAILGAARESGLGISNDLNGKKLTGFSIAQATQKNGVRRSSARAYLWPGKNRKNLHVSLNSQATKVIVKNGAAVGVEYYKNGKLKRVRVSREVVVSAGNIGSPHLLLLSGIGPKKHLKSVGIKPIIDLPGVGENFHDQVTYMLFYTINETNAYDNDYEIAKEYLTNQTGPLSCTGLPQVIGAFESKETSPGYPDLQVYFGGYSTACAPGEIGALATNGSRIIVIRAVNLRPKSRGRITLASKDPLKYPVIWGNYLSDRRDIDRLIDAIKLAQKLAKTRALKAHNFTLYGGPIKACSKYPFNSRKYWTCAILQQARPELHMGGTCKMGPSSDPMAVVDPQLRVHGIKGLRVADASIMPQVTSGNTAAPTMMIGERAADFIKKHWAQKLKEKT